MQLRDVRTEVRRELWNPGGLIGARCHHHVVRLVPCRAGPDHIPAVRAGESVNVDPGADRKPESGRIRLEIVGHLVLCGIRPSRRREGPARQPVIASRREHPQRVPSVAPRVADPLVGFQDHKGLLPPRQVVSNRQPGLAASDDHGLETGLPGYGPQLELSLPDAAAQTDLAVRCYEQVAASHRARNHRRADKQIAEGQVAECTWARARPRRRPPRAERRPDPETPSSDPTRATGQRSADAPRDLPRMHRNRRRSGGQHHDELVGRVVRRDERAATGVIRLGDADEQQAPVCRFLGGGPQLVSPPGHRERRRRVAGG